MGACDISLDLKGKATREQITKAFNAQRKHDADENGHQSGYSGDFQTVDTVDFHLGKVFSSENEAMEYCLEKSVKWHSVVAVYYNCSTPVKSKTLDKLNDKYKAAVQYLEALKQRPIDGTQAFKTCSNCKSRLALAHVKRPTCPVCSADLRTKGMQAKITKAETKIAELKTKAKAIVDKENAKQAAKGKHVNTLVAGWGAC